MDKKIEKIPQRVFDGLTGKSEADMRLAVQAVETIGPCILWADEVGRARTEFRMQSSPRKEEKR